MGTRLELEAPDSTTAYSPGRLGEGKQLLMMISPLWSRGKVVTSPSGPGFDPRSGQISWLFFLGFLLNCKTCQEKLRPIHPWISLAVIIIRNHFARAPMTFHVHSPIYNYINYPQ